MISKTPGENENGYINGEAGGLPLPFAVHTLYFLGFKIKDFTFFVMFFFFIGPSSRNVDIVYIIITKSDNTDIDDNGYKLLLWNKE